MSPQFVDFDHDGKLDIVAGIFDGSPHVAFGSEQGFKAPEQILDRDGQRILLNMFWNFDAKKWDTTKRCNPDGLELPEGQCTSAFAWDIDDDGDYDLLLGDYKSGYLYLRRNYGKRGEPRFATVNEPVLLGKEPLQVPHKMATPLVFDWDGDQLPDLLIGSIGGTGEGGAVYFHRNIGKQGAPQWAQPAVLIESGRAGRVEEMVRPDGGLYMDAGDIDGDGDLDLIVGGYCTWAPKGPSLDDEQKARLQQLQADMKKVDAETTAIVQALTKAVEGLSAEAAAEKRKELAAARQTELTELSKQRQALNRQIETMAPGARRHTNVWLYENLKVKAAMKPAGNQ